VIFAPNHHSHLDTPTMLTSIPEPWRHKVSLMQLRLLFRTRLTRWRLPRDRGDPDRALQGHPRSAGQAAVHRRRLVDAHLPEGGRSPTAGANSEAGATSSCCGVPVVPLHIEGTAGSCGRARPTPAAVRSPTARRCPRGRRERIEVRRAIERWRATTRLRTVACPAAGGRTTPPLTDRTPWRGAEPAPGDRSWKRRRQTRTWPKPDVAGARGGPRWP
jgi:1-acyl-sn-glycerol-3-phosphate acyltransferase